MKYQQRASISRRGYLAAVGGFSSLWFSGCIQEDENPNVVAVVRNNRDEAVEFSIEFSSLDPEEQVLSEEAELGPDKSREYQDVFETGGKKRVTIETADGTTGSYSWTIDSVPSSSGVIVYITNEIEFSYGSG